VGAALYARRTSRCCWRGHCQQSDDLRTDYNFAQNFVNQIVVTILADSEFQLVMGDYNLVWFTIPIRDMSPQLIPGDLTPILTPEAVPKDWQDGIACLHGQNSLHRNNG
jgi:hypothetical protein